LLNSHARGKVLPYLWCLLHVLLSLHTPFQILRDSSKNYGNSTFHNYAHIGSSLLLRHLSPHFKNITPLISNTSPNYWKCQTNFSIPIDGTIRQNQFYKLSFSQAQISIHTTRHNILHRQKIHITTITTLTQHGRIIRLFEIHNFTITSFRHKTHIGSSQLSTFLSQFSRKLNYIQHKDWIHQHTLFIHLHHEILKIQDHKINLSPTSYLLRPQTLSIIMLISKTLTYGNLRKTFDFKDLITSSCLTHFMQRLIKQQYDEPSTSSRQPRQHQVHS